jgi:hypothetical protein
VLLLFVVEIIEPPQVSEIALITARLNMNAALPAEWHAGEV